MSVLICSTTYGGCGHVGKGTEWTRIGPKDSDCIFCPVCGQDYASQLTDQNFESWVNDSNREKARNMLDSYNASIHGEFLQSFVQHGVIAEDNLTEEQKTELGLS